MPTLPALVFGKVQRPPIVDRTIPNSQTSAWNNLGKREGIGVVQHSMVGNLRSTDAWFRDSAYHKADGLTDFGVGNDLDGDLDGVIYMWNNYLGYRSGWANGGSDGLEGDGPAFVRLMGVNAINRALASIERSDGGDLNRPMSPKQFDSITKLTAWLADQAQIPWSSFPINPKYGIVTYFGHFEFATKDCPFDWVQAHFPQIIARVREIMKAAQVVGNVDVPDGPVISKPVPANDLPNGWTFEELRHQFGVVPEVDLREGLSNMKVEGRTFNEKGMISNMWIAKAVELGIKDVNRIPKIAAILLNESRDGVASSILHMPRSGWPDEVAFKGDGNSTWRWGRF